MNKKIASLLSSTFLTASFAYAAVESPVTDGLLIGLDGSDVTMDGGQVQYWNDQAALGGDQDFYQATLGNRPSLLTGFSMPDGSTHDILDFNGSDEFLSITADSNMETNTITTFAVVRANAMEDGSSDYFISNADSQHDRRWTTGERSTNNRWIILANSDGGLQKIIDLTGIAQDEWCIVSMTWNGAAAGELGARSLNTEASLKTGATTGATSAVYPHVRTRIGCNSADSPGYHFNGQLAEILVYNRVLSTKEITNVEQYLRYKYLKSETVMPPVTDGLLVGLDGSDAKTIGVQQIRYWNDQAADGGAANFYQGTLASCPILLTNSTMPNGTIHNIADFDGANDYLSIGADSSLSTNTITSFVVVRGNAMEDGTTGYAIASADSPVRWGIGERGTGNTWFFLSRTSNGTAYIPNLNGIQDQWYIVSMSWSGDTGSVLSRALSQDDILVTDSKADIVNISATHTRTRIGSNADSSVNLPFDGQMAEVLIYNRALPLSEVQSVEEYLKYKYFENIPPLGTVILIQ